MNYGATLDPPRVLVIDDEPETCLTLQRLFERDGFDVSCAATIADALLKIEEEQPAAILVDVRLGSESGLDLLDLLRARGDARPTIVISVVDSMEVKLDAVHRGCDAYFAKPIDWDVLVRKLRQLIEPPIERRRHHVLVVEDDPDQSEYLAAILRDAGYEADSCADLASFEKAMSRLHPDLVLLDVHLPDASGYDIARYLRQHDRFAATPVIFLTADSSHAGEIEAIAAGGDDHLRKPVSSELLLASVAARLSRAVHVQSLLERDGLTGLLTYAGFTDRASAVIAEKRRHPELSFTLVFLDVDHFKAVNDRHGHVAGDRVLASLGGFLKRSLRENDVVSRYGGEEFAMLVNATEPDTQALFQRMLEEFSAFTHHDENGNPFLVTFTGGTAELKPGMTLEEWKLLADRALYLGKRSGRKTIVSGARMTDEVLDPLLLAPLVQLQVRSGVPIVAAIRELFLDALPSRIDECQRAIASGDARGVEHAAHAFRSAAGNLGAVKLVGLCAQLELAARQQNLERAGDLVPELIAESERVAASLRSSAFGTFSPPR